LFLMESLLFGMNYLQVQKVSAPPEVAKHYDDLQMFYQQKLYFQLSSKLLELSMNEHFQKEERLLKLYDNFASKLENRGKAVDYVRFCVAASRQHQDPQAALDFLAKLHASLEEDEHDAKLLLNMEVVLSKVHMGRADECKDALEEARSHLESRMGVSEAAVNAAIYRAAATYYKVKGPAAQFFQNSLLYLAYAPLESIPIPEQISMAVDVGLAALVGNNIYNFGELLQHPILQVLKGTQYEWLADLLAAFNSGNIKLYQTIAEEKGISQEVLVRNAPFLNQKIRVMALMEMVFRRASDDRTFTFEEMKQTCQLPINEVEFLIMKAFSLQVVKGVIDQVEQTVRIKYVQPRVLDKDQIANMRDRLLQWSKEVDNVSLYVEQNASELVHKI